MMKTTFTNLALLIASMAFFNACSKQENTSTAAASNADADAIPMVPKEHRSINFEPVAAKLDLGGIHYTYMDFGTALKDLGSNIGQMIQLMQQFDPTPELMMASMVPYDQAIEALGISNLAAYGASTYHDGDLFVNKSAVYMPDGVKGLFTIAGKEAHDFTSLQMAPEDADFFFETSIHSSAIEDIIQTVAKQVYGDESEQYVEGFLSARASPDAPSWGEILNKSNTTITVVMRLGAPVTVEAPEIGPIAIPSIEFVFGMQGMSWLVEDNVFPVDDMISSQEGEMTIYRDAKKMDDEYTADWDPALITMGQDLYLVNQVSFLQECFSGKTKLTDSAEYKAATAGFPKQGNALMYASKDTFNAYVDFRDLMVENEPMAASVMPIYEWIMPILTIPRQKHASASIVIVDETSIFSQDRWPIASSGGGAVTSTTTIGLLAAMAIPAFNKVREQSREKAIINNLRIVAASGQQYILEEGVVSVDYQKLEGNYFESIESVNGEDYSQLVISEDGGTLEVTTESGETITFTY